MPKVVEEQRGRPLQMMKDLLSKGKTTGMALRVPTIDVSAFDPTAEITKQTTWTKAAQRRNAAQRHERLPRLN